MWPTEQKLESGKGNDHTGVTQPSAAPMLALSAPGTQTARVCLRLPPSRRTAAGPQPAAGHSSPPRSVKRKSETGKGDHRAGDRQEPYWHRRCQRPARARPPPRARPQSARRARGHPPSRTNRSPPPSTATPHGPPSESRNQAKGTAARLSPGTGVVSAPSAGTAPSATTSVCKRTAPAIPHSEPQMPDGREK